MAEAWREGRDIRGERAAGRTGDEAWREGRDIRGEHATGRAERSIATLAGRQHGVASRRQLRHLGLSDDAIDRRIAAGRLHRLHRGVYAVGHTVIGARGRWMAAVLACGDGAALSHEAAAALWGIRRRDAARIDVTVPTTAGRSQRPGLRIHRTRMLRPDEVTAADGIPVTTPARTLLDLAATLDTDALKRALDRAEILELTDYPTLDAVARAHPEHPGSTRLRRTLRTYVAGTVTRSSLEELFLALCRRHGLPAPRVNAYVCGFEVDFLFDEQRLVVETDGWRYHGTRQAFERDRDRDATLLLEGYRTLRVTYHRLQRAPDVVAATLKRLLAA
jgi:very-short-patch-repair endonuclease